MEAISRAYTQFFNPEPRAYTRLERAVYAIALTILCIPTYFYNREWLNKSWTIVRHVTLSNNLNVGF